MNKKVTLRNFRSGKIRLLIGWLLIAAYFIASCLYGAQSGRLTLTTYNIHHAAGTDGVLSLERIVDDIRHADVIGLQEVDRHFDERSQFEDQAGKLAEALGYYHVFAPNLNLGPGTGDPLADRSQYGIALLSRYPIEYARNYPLPKIQYVEGISEQRGLLETQLQIGERKLRVYVTHLSHSSQEQRLLQVKSVREIILSASGTGPPSGTLAIASSFVVMGDFNFPPSSEEYALVTGEWRQDRQLVRKDGFVDAWRLVEESPGHTIGLDGSRGRRIDYIFVSPDLADLVISGEVNSETRASDHQPVSIVIEGF